MAETKLKAAEIGLATAGGAFKVRRLRWLIIGLVFLATLINYIDHYRAVTSPTIFRWVAWGLRKKSRERSCFWPLKRRAIWQAKPLRSMADC
jgi:hypothetical protein